MDRYNVAKYFGHYRQDWRIEAESDEDAWNRAEKDGILSMQSLYREPFDAADKGYVANITKNQEENKPISQEQADEWLRESEKMGMVITKAEYERIYGLPFKNVF